MSLNHITISGRLTRDPELRRTGQGTAVTSFTVAVDRDIPGKDGSRETDFIDCVAWRQTGEFVAKYFTQGRMIIVDGKLQIRTWKDKQGNNRKTAEVNADNVYFGDSKPEAAGNGSYGGSHYNNGYSGLAPATGGYSYAAPAAPASDFAMLDDDDPQLPY